MAIFFLAVLTAISNQFPVLILEARSSIEQVGIYNAGAKLLNPVKLLLAISLTAIFPNISSYYLKNKALFIAVVSNGIIVFFTIGAMVGFVFMLFSDTLIVIIFGGDYADAAKVISIQVWYTVLYSIFSLMGTTLGAIGKQKQLSFLSLGYAVVALPVYWIGSKNGAVGLATSFLIAACINFVYHWAYFKNADMLLIEISKKVKITKRIAVIVVSFLFALTFKDTLNIYIKLLVIIIATAVSGFFMIKRLKISKYATGNLIS